MAKESLAVKYIEYMEIDEEDRGTTFDDFYDWVGVEPEYRTDFATAAILKQAFKIMDIEL